MIGPRWEVCTPWTNNVNFQGEFISLGGLILWGRNDIAESITVFIKTILILYLPRVLCIFPLCVNTHIQTHTIQSLLFFTLCLHARGKESCKSVRSRRWWQLGSMLEFVCCSSQPESLKMKYMRISERCLILGKFSIKRWDYSLSYQL